MKSCCVLQEHYDDKRDKIVFHNHVTSHDPGYMTAEIKAKLRRKNRLMRLGRVEEAGALARQIGRDITRRSRRQLENINYCVRGDTNLRAGRGQHQG